MSLLKAMDWGAAAPRVARQVNRRSSRAAESPADEMTGGFDVALAAQLGKRSENQTPSDSAPSKVDKSADSSPEKSTKEDAADDKSQGQTSDAQAAGQTGTQPFNADAQNAAPSSDGSAPKGAGQAAAALSANVSADSTHAAKSALADAPGESNGARAAQPKVKNTPEATPRADPTAQAPQTAEDSSAPSETAPTPPPLADQAGQQAHEQSRHAAHVKALESDAPSAESPPPPGVATAAAPAVPMEAALAEATAPAIPIKEDAPKPAEASATPLIAGESKAGTAGTARAESAPAAQESPRADAPDTMDQIVLGLKGKLDARTGKAEIRLDPPNLGVLKVSVTLDNGTLTAEFQSASSVVRDLLKGNLDKLKTALQGQGVAVDRLAVDAPPDAGGTGQNPQASFGSAAHDGRSAGQYQQDPRSGQQRSGGEGFARLFSQAQEAPLDLVA